MTIPSDQVNLAPLIGEPKRQAVDSMLGYDYQVWRSLEVWMRLEDNEILYLECAEDFDLISPKGGTAIQVKNSPGNITLGSADVREAILNHLTNIEKNANRSVKMRYLSRGDIGKEKGKPFGYQRGLDLWNAVSKDNHQNEHELTNYLLQNVNDQRLQRFLSSSTPEQRIEKLYRSLEWVVQEPTIDAVRITVQRAAIERGNKYGIVTHISAKAVPALLEKCRQVAEEKLPELRGLTSIDLQKTFDENTFIPIPATLSALSMLEKSLTHAASGNHSLVFSSFEESGELPPLPQFVMPRESFLKAVTLALSNGPSLIVGTEGKGKSIIANLVGSEDRLNSYWSVLPYENERIILSLERLLMLVRSRLGPQLIILDDVPALSGINEQIWVRLFALFESCKANKIQLLMTAKGVPENLIDSKFRSANVQVLAVPTVSEIEVECFFESLGCPKAIRNTWSKTILLQSGNGHPKLVYLAGLELKDLNWPTPSEENFIKPPASIEEARANARHSVARVVDESDKNYLYTLSVSTLPFSRKLALKVGGMLGITAPGEAFDRLAGRWIEAKERNHFAVTNLLLNQAQETYPPNIIEKAHSIIFDAFISEDSINVAEAWGVFLNAFLSNDHKRLGIFLTSLISTDFKAVPGLGESLEILLSMASDNTLLGKYDANISSMFRHLQFKIAGDVKPEKMEEIARQWSLTIDQIVDSKVSLAARVVWGASIACNMEGSFSPDILVQAISNFSLVKQLDIDPLDTSFLTEFLKIDGTPTSHEGLLFMFAQSHCDGFSFVNKTLDALENLEPRTRDLLLQAFESEEMISTSMITKAWLVEFNKPNPNWDGLLNTFARAYSLSITWRSQGLGVNVARIKSIIFDEEETFNDQELANEALDEASKEFGNLPILDDQRANIQFRAKNYNEALKLWETTLDLELNTLSKVRSPFAFRKAAIAAFKIGDYLKAAQIFERAGEIKQFVSYLPKVSFAIDAAYCWIKNKDLVQALKALSMAAIELKEVYEPSERFELFCLQKFCGSCAVWMLDQLIPNDLNPEEPIEGVASSPDKFEQLASLPPTPYPYIAFTLLRIANFLDIDEPYLDQLKCDVDACKIPFVKLQNASLQVDKVVALNNFSEFGYKILNLIKASWQLKAAQESDISPLVDMEYIVSENIKAQKLLSEWNFILPLAILKMSGEDPLVWASKWRDQIDSVEYIPMLDAELQIATEGFSMGVNEARAFLKNVPTIKSIAASAIILSEAKRLPSETFNTQICFIVWIFSRWIGKESLIACLPTLTDLFSKQWSSHLAFPAGLAEPRYSIPQLQRAMSFQGLPLNRLKLLLMAGSTATRLLIPEIAKDALKKLDAKI